jgi:hypothetical protein
VVASFRPPGDGLARGPPGRRNDQRHAGLQEWASLKPGQDHSQDASVTRDGLQTTLRLISPGSGWRLSEEWRGIECFFRRADR